MNKKRKQFLFITLGSIGIGMFISFLLLTPKEDLTNTSNIITGICLFGISMLTLIQGTFIKT